MFTNDINTEVPRIMHVDLNSCFATVSQQAHIHLRNKPLVIAAYATARGCILAPSIEAKRFGIKTGMTVAEAKMICPSVIVRTPEVGLIRDVHTKFRRICCDYAPDVSERSIDEFVIDFHGMDRVMQADLATTGREIKRRLKEEVGDWMRCNVGISINCFLAKVAAGLHKPDGLDIITHKNLLSVYGLLKLVDLPGINLRYKARLNANGIFTPMDFFNASATVLKRSVFGGITGYYWYFRLRGWEIDQIDFARKSFGQQYALGKKTNDPRELTRLLYKLTEKMGRRLRRAEFGAFGIAIAVSYEDRSFWHKTKKIARELYTTKELFLEAWQLLNLQPKKKRVVLLAVSCFNLEKHTHLQISLFDSLEKEREVSKALDKINDRYGEFTITPATLLNMKDVIFDRIAFGKAGFEIFDTPKESG